MSVAWIALYVSSGSLFVSIGSLILALLSFLRDRPRMRVTSKYFPEPKGHAQIRLSIVNIGRRPVVLKWWGGPVNNRRSSVVSYFKGHKEGLRLAENDHHEETLDYRDLFLRGPDGDMLEDLWVEDSHGRRRRAKNGKRNTIRLRTGATTTG